MCECKYLLLFIYNCQGLNLAFFLTLQLELLIVDPGVLQDSLNTPWLQEETFPIFLNSHRKAEAGHFTPADENLP